MSSHAARGTWAADGLRFLVAGAANTTVTLAIFQLLLFLMPSWMAYTLSWLSGLLLVMIFYPSRVFAGARRDLTARVWLGASYAAVFLLGLGALRVLGMTGISARISIFAVLAITTAANFLLGRLILKAGTRSGAANPRND
jgi:putative flippase GtrA